MSLTNPTELRQARATRRRPVVRGIVSTVMLSSLAVAGYAWGQQFILGFDKANDPLLATAIVSGVIAWFSFLLFSISTLGSWRLAPWLLVLGLLLFGTGLIAPGLSIGDPLFDFPDWLGLIPIGLALLLALSLIRARGLRERREQRETHTQNTGSDADIVIELARDNPLHLPS